MDTKLIGVVVTKVTEFALYTTMLVRPPVRGTLELGVTEALEPGDAVCEGETDIVVEGVAETDGVTEILGVTEGVVDALEPGEGVVLID